MRKNEPFRHGLIKAEDSLLVVIEMQERLFPAMTGRETLYENVERLVRFSQLLDLPVIFTEMDKLGGTLPQIQDLVRDFEAIKKVHFDCFANASFRERVGEVNRNTLIVSGIEAHICVAQTAIHALADYRVHVVSDAVASRSPHNLQIALERMAQAGVTISSTEMVIYELLQEAGTDTFREALKLVK